MRYFIIALLALSGLGSRARAQDELPKLTIPSSPAFSILGFEPASVMRPTSNKDLAADVLNSFDKNGNLLMNLGLEVTPYWWKSRPLPREEYLNPDVSQAFLQSFSLSAATVKDSASGDNKLGGGLRFKLINGKPVPELRAQEEKLLKQSNIIGAIGATIGLVKSGRVTSRKEAMNLIDTTLSRGGTDRNIINELWAQASQIIADYQDDAPDIQQFLEKLNELREASLGELKQKVAVLNKQRRGFILEFAGAASFITSRGNTTDRVGVWANASNYVSETDLFTFTARYMFQNGDTAQSNFDAGLSYQKTTDKFNVSIEAMVRWYRAESRYLGSLDENLKRIDRDVTYRIAAQGSYMVSPDLSINLSIGKNFDNPYFSANSFFSILGFNFSIFNKERVRL